MDDAEKVAAVKAILDRWTLSPQQRLRAIGEVLHPPRAEPRPSPTDERGWPLMGGVAWERHDYPEEQS